MAAVAPAVDRLGERAVAGGGLLLQAAGMAWIALMAEPDLVYASMIAPMVIAGLGVSAAVPAVQKAVLSAAGTAQVGRASGTFNTIRQLGGTFGTAVLVAAFRKRRKLRVRAGVQRRVRRRDRRLGRVLARRRRRDPGSGGIGYEVIVATTGRRATLTSGPRRRQPSRVLTAAINDRRCTDITKSLHSLAAHPNAERAEHPCSPMRAKRAEPMPKTGTRVTHR
jgi:hypothetical protein